MANSKRFLCSSQLCFPFLLMPLPLQKDNIINFSGTELFPPDILQGSICSQQRFLLSLLLFLPAVQTLLENTSFFKGKNWRAQPGNRGYRKQLWQNAVYWEHYSCRCSPRDAPHKNSIRCRHHQNRPKEQMKANSSLRAPGGVKWLSVPWSIFWEVSKLCPWAAWMSVGFQMCYVFTSSLPYRQTLLMQQYWECDLC